jgi:hypothetical protein
MKCIHKWKTINTISRKAHNEGSKKFKSGFEEANDYGIKILVARQKQCSECGIKRSTVEISKNQLNQIYSQLDQEVESDNENDELSSFEKKVRAYLIAVSKGEISTRHSRKAMYKEVWLHIYPSRPFGRGNTNEVVEWIVNISNYDTASNRPPLNSLVVRGDTGMPGESWEEWRINSKTSYETIDKAQQACWKFWS